MGSAPPDDEFADAVRRHGAGDLDGAEAAYRRILERDPGHARALHLLGVLDHQRGRHEEALAKIDAAIALDPTRAMFHGNRGVVLCALGRQEEAIAAQREAIRLRPEYADAHSNLGAALHQVDRYDDALAALLEALRLKPGHADALYNLGNLYRDRGDARAAVDLYRRALATAPRRADIWNNLGGVLGAIEEPDEADRAFRRALELDPGSVDAVLNLASAHLRRDLVDEAVAYYRRAAELRPDDPRWPISVASLCPAVFPDTRAIERYRATLESALDAHRDAQLPWDRDGAANAGCIPPFNMAHHGFDDRRLRSKFARLYREPAPRPRAARRVGPPRVGFVVTHPHEGVFLRCCSGLINRLTPGRLRPAILGSAQGIDTLRRAVDHPEAEFVPFPDRFHAAAERIGAAACDLLYHWEVGTDPLNYLLPFARLAPVQCTSWGVQVTSGVPAIDGYLSSDLSEPPGAEAHYSERLVRLGSLLAYTRREPRPDPPADRSEFGLPRDAHLYACLQRPQKLHPDFDALLGEILRRDPAGLVVLLKGRGDRIGEQLTARFRQTLPDVVGRVALFPYMPASSYHRLLSLADVVLDPLHYGVGSSAYDIFSYDLPLVTLPGPYNASRYALACYRQMGLADLVVSSPRDYAETAVRLGTDPGFRASWTARLAASTPWLFEDADVVREYERCFEELVDRGPAPAH